MATPLLGKVDNFDPELEEWPQYVERLEQFFEANGITGDGNAAKRRSVFLTVIGPSPYKLLRNLLSPVKPSTKSFEELAAVLEQHYSPKPSEVMQRFRFHSRFRRPGERVAEFVAELRRLAEFCNFGATLEEMIRDRLVCGINDESVQRKLLAEQELTYQKAMSIAKGTEAAVKNLQEMKAPVQEASAAATIHVKKEPVHKVEEKPPSCHRCGDPTHLAPKCRFQNTVCHNCRKRGHLARVCRSNPGPKKPDSVGRDRQPFRRRRGE